MKYLKSISLSLLLYSLFPVLLGAQGLAVENSQIEYEDYQVTSVQVKVSPDRSSLQDAFEDWIKDKYDVKMRRPGLFGDKTIRQAEAVRLPSISSGQINLFTKTVAQDGYTEMNLFASRGLANFMDDDNEMAFRAMENMMTAFLADYLPVYYQEQVDEAKESLSDLKDELEDVEDDYADNQETIADLQEENQELNARIGVLNKEIQNNQQEVELRLQRQQMINKELSDSQ